MTAPVAEAPKDLVGFLDLYLVHKAPFQIPDAGREWLVRFGPWITLVLLILALPPLLIALGVGTVLVPVGGAGYATGFGIFRLAIIVEIGLMAAALPGLFDRRMAGWNLLFYAELAGIARLLLTGAIVGGLLLGLISLYILFQVRPLYR